MNTPSKRTFSLLSALLLLSASCSGTTSTSRSATGAVAARLHAGPLSQAIALVSSRDVVQAKLASGAQVPLAPGKALAGVTSLRAGDAPALVRLGAHGRIYLRAGTVVHLGRTKHAALGLLVERGEARVVCNAASGALTTIAGRSVSLAGRDVLVGPDYVTPTAERLRRVGWALALERGVGPARLGTLSVRRRAPASAAAAAATNNNAPANAAATNQRDVAYLSLRRVRVDAKRAGDAAYTEIEHVFYNPSDQRLEGTFRFPLPTGATLVGLAMEINGKLMDGELVERHKAQQIYQSIVDSMRDPAILEWQQGNIFKLRVFPIEPRQEKRIVLRYVAPLARAAAGGLEYSFATATPAMQKRIARFTLRFDGRAVVDQRGFRPGREITVPLGATASAANTAYVQTRPDGTYYAMRLASRFASAAAAAAGSTGAAARPARDLVLIVDTSRSALESRRLALDTARALLVDLRAGDRFVLVASDIDARPHAAALVPASAAAAEQALAFLGAIKNDGATDVGLALRRAGELLAAANTKGATRTRARTRQVVYLGDGTATWGVTDAKALAALSDKALGGATLHAAILGRGADGALLRRLAAHSGGRAQSPKTALDARRFALFVGEAPRLARLAKATLSLPEGSQATLYSNVRGAIYAGDALYALVRVPAGKGAKRAAQPGALPQLTLRASLGGKPYVETFKPRVAAPAAWVAQRWARHHIAKLQHDGAAKEAIVAESLKHGVMSRHTAFLVLESEAAYKRFKIARKHAAAQKKLASAAPRVSGADLESLRGRRASMSPDHLQPGDPEIRIPAPADARSVVVFFPFGETKVARYERAHKAWTVRFLVDQNTPDGVHRVRVRIVHRDGRVELLSLNYVVDTKAPVVYLRALPRRDRQGRRYYVIVASQIVTRAELTRELLRHRTITGTRKQYAELVKDIKHVDVRLPDGNVLSLRARRRGVLVGVYRPATPLAGPVTLTFVVVDQAYNRRIVTRRFDPRSGRLQRVSR
ncbi:MAG: hypothetical protein KC503_27490 [Myxococcales bacterium]|nr:hypothetical protein [Myxococcales bacterium]